MLLQSTWTCITLLMLVPVGRGYLLTGIRLMTDVPKLPQFAQLGRSMVLVGGNLNENNTEIYGTIVDMAGGKGVAKIGIINAASADPMDGYHYYHDQFMKYGVKEANRIPIDLNHTHNAADQQTIDMIYQQTGFFFGGGDQARIIRSFLDAYGGYTPALIALHQMFDAGAVISRTSAGTTCQTANLMIEGGVSYDALKFGSYPDVGVSDGKDDEVIYVSTGGIGFMKGYVLDSHFSDRGREGRMIRLLEDTRRLAKGTNYGIGVDENTALVVTHADTDQMAGKVLGAYGVAFFDVSKARVITGTNFHISNVYNTYLTHGDVYHFRDHSVTFAPAKSAMTGHEKYVDALTTDDVFYRRQSTTRKPEYIRIATSVFDSQSSRTTYGTTHESSPRFRVNMSATGHSAEGWVERKRSFHSDITSYKSLRIEILQA